MDQEQEQIEQSAEQDNADFLSGFNAVRPDDAQALPEQKQEVAPEETPAQEEEAKEEAKAEADEPTFFGMSESQIKSLLERSAQVDEIKDQLRKAHGKIGELNSTVQNLSSQRQQPTQQAPATSLDEGEMSQWEQDFPELAQLAEAKARKIATEMMSGQVNSQSQSISRDEIVREANLAIMDANYDGWRDTINTQDFALWIATQPADVQEQFNNTVSAKVLGGVLSSFDNWKNKVADRGNKSKARLEQALIPSGNAAKVSHAPSAHDEFVAGFNAVRANY